MIFSYLLNMQSHPSWVCGLKLNECSISFYVFSHTLRGCVDWNHRHGRMYIFPYVTPFVGVWIETSIFVYPFHKLQVTPFVGVWIETPYHRSHPLRQLRHTLRGCVDWNTGLVNMSREKVVTPFVGVWIETEYRAKLSCCPTSHPSWVCGLKHSLVLGICQLRRHTLRGCVDWNLSW